MSRYLLGLDIGGTFTDFVLLEAASGRMWVHKCLSTPDDPARGALEGAAALLRDRNLRMSDLALIIHGTTLVANALIERRGARTGLLTTRGFRDILAMGKEQRYDVYDLFLRLPDPLVPRRWRRGVAERLDRDGEVIVPLDPQDVAREAAAFVADGVESIAVGFLHAYANPAHERAAAEVVARAFPSVSVSLSSDVVAEIREYERIATTCANAYVRPLVDRYVAVLERAFVREDFTGRFYLMQSSGGTATPDAVRRLPVRLLESGPAAGAIAAAFHGRRLGREHVVSFDMGGTTAKACLIDGGAPEVTNLQEAARVHRFKRGSGIPIKSPAVDMIEIGAGGGSIARVSPLGLLKVGPESAGADPGPACYGRGGVEPTVTDANLLLGYLDPEYFLGGRMGLDVEAARTAVGRLADRLGIGLTEAAWGIHSIVNENMGAAARMHIAERGRDPRRYSLLAFGGAGPVHACPVAHMLGAREVILPVVPGAASALGLLIAPLAFEFSRSYPALLDEIDWAVLNRAFADMEEGGVALLREAGVESEDAQIVRTADMRLAGQFHEISVPVPSRPLGPDTLAALRSAFETEYRRRHSHIYEGNPVMALTWRVRVAGPTPNIVLRQDDTAAAGGGTALRGRRAVYFPGSGYVDTPVYDRYRLAPGFGAAGPAVVEERESTALVYPGDWFAVDDHLNVLVALTPQAGGRAR